MTAALPVVSGIVVLLVTLADVFFTVLFPASGHGPLRRPLSRLVWGAFRSLARLVHGAARRRLLSYAGPTLIASTIVAWPVLLVIGWALVYYPALGTGILASSGSTSRTAVAAFYFSGFSLTTLGTGDIVPVAGLYRVLVVIEAATGFATVSMVIAYFMSVYGAVVQRRTFAAALHHRTLRTGDAARLITALAAQGDVAAVVQQLSTMGDFLQQLLETHRSYPVLRYFHYRQVQYALPRVLLVTLDATTLLRSSQRGDQPTVMQGDAAVALVEGAARELLDELSPGTVRVHADENRAAQLRDRYAEARRRLRGTCLSLREGPGGADEYVRGRQVWDEPLRALAAATVYEWREIEPLQTWVGPSVEAG